jgi:hypothetical protein
MVCFPGDPPEQLWWTKNVCVAKPGFLPELLWRCVAVLNNLSSAARVNGRIVLSTNVGREDNLFGGKRMYLFFYTSRCLLPKRRASTENAPGPSIAEVAPMVANIIGIHGSLMWVAATHNSTTAINAPTNGVQSPTRKSMPAHAPMMCGIIAREKDESVRWITQKATSKIAAIAR